jgi:DNA-binding NtrC family response regulator
VARFEVVNCGALTRELLLSELFGHERGAFTGAIERRPGILSAADGGTVFLDEVGELPPEAQVMLLRFLANGEIRPVGSTRTTRVDVRVIAATHRDLESAMRQGTFREDLYYRLRRVVLEVPPLRARGEDIPLLVEHFRLRFNERYGLAVDGLTDAAMQRLESYPWPGNVRELEAVLEQAMIFKGRGWLAPRDLDLRPVTLEITEMAFAEARPGGHAGMTPYQAEALRIAGRRGEVCRRDLVRRFGISREVVRRQLVALAQAGLLRQVGSGRGARYVLGRRPEGP